MGTITNRFTEGWTGPIEYQLLHEDPDTGIQTPFDASDTTPSLVMHDKDGNAVTLKGTTEWVDAKTSKVKFSPDSEDLVAAGSPYTVRFKVTDQTGKDVFFPQGEAMVWRVFSQ